MEELASLRPDVIVVCAFGVILRQPVLDTPAKGVLNVHPSLLPRHRGASPIAAAILAGDEQTGVTIMLLDPGMDTGPILSQRAVPVSPLDTSGSLGERLAEVDSELLLEVLPRDRLLRITKEEAQLSKQETTKMLVRGLAHEIKNPLGGIRGAAQLLARELPEEHLKDYTEVIIEEADRLRNLVDRMLGSNKLPSLAMTNIHEVLEHVASLIEAECQGSLILVRDYDPSIPEVLMDRAQMIQAVLNIMRNAMQALAGQSELGLGRLTLRTRSLRQFTIGHIRHRLVARIEIIDNGPGIPAELQNTLFYPMVSGRPDGTGLGLAITQNIISQHQGLIECESHPGHTAFSIFLPLEQGAPTA
ncbi:MAG TPA: PAS domain-containing sensor histidine kinase [Pseudomonas sp.]|nr:PAS domain-containing sensor histidine kinase [Pseudomonas sp.]